MTVSNTTQQLIDMLTQRDAMGRQKYGTSLDRSDLSSDQWTQHAVEELLDAAGYLLALRRTQSQGGGEVESWQKVVLCPECRGAGGQRWHEADGSERGERCGTCDGFGHVNAPPSAPVGVEALCWNENVDPDDTEAVINYQEIEAQRPGSNPPAPVGRKPAPPPSPPSAPVGVDEAAEDTAAIDKAWGRFKAALAPQPPAEAQAQGGGEVVAEVLRIEDGSAVVALFDDSLTVGSKLYTAPPSAPVGVDGLNAAAVEAGHITFESMKQCADSWLAVVDALNTSAPGWCEKKGTGRECAVAAIAALAQQPAAAPVGVEGCLDRLRQHRSQRLWKADLVGGQISVERMRAILHVALAQQPAAEFRNDGNSEADFIAHHADACTACGGSGHKADQQPAAVDGAWQVQLADALECFWNPAIEGSGDDRSNIIGGMVQGFAAVAYRLREHAALAAQPGGDQPQGGA